MPKPYRLARADFARMRGFRRIQGRFFSLSFGTIPERTRAGAAIVVSKKVAPDAFDRNRIKRRSRAIFLRFLPSLVPSGVFVAIAKKGAAAATFDEQAADLTSLFERATREGK